MWYSWWYAWLFFTILLSNGKWRRVKGEQKIACYTTPFSGWTICFSSWFPCLRMFVFSGLRLWATVLCSFFRIANIMFSTNRSMTYRHRMKNQKTHTKCKQWTVNIILNSIRTVFIYDVSIILLIRKNLKVQTFVYIVVFTFHHCRMFLAMFPFHLTLLLSIG